MPERGPPGKEQVSDCASHLLLSVGPVGSGDSTHHWRKTAVTHLPGDTKLLALKKKKVLERIHATVSVALPHGPWDQQTPQHWEYLWYPSTPWGPGGPTEKSVQIPGFTLSAEDRRRGHSWLLGPAGCLTVRHLCLRYQSWSSWALCCRPTSNQCAREVLHQGHT